LWARDWIAIQDKVNSFWEITKKDLEDKKAELRNKDREMEEMEERHQVEIKVYKQKVKHLLYEHQNNVTTLKADGEMALKLQQDEFAKREEELQQDKRSLKLDLKEMELAHEDVVRSLKLDQAKEITKLRQEFQLNAKELQNKYEKKVRLRPCVQHACKWIHSCWERSWAPDVYGAGGAPVEEYGPSAERWLGTAGGALEAARIRYWSPCVRLRTHRIGRGSGLDSRAMNPTPTPRSS
jgi:hypothetical protein